MQLRNALAARTEAVPFPGAAHATLPDETDRPVMQSLFPPDARAVIHCPAPSAMSSRRRGAAEWVLEFEPRARLFVESLMGWTGSMGTLSQVRLRFPTRETAIAYARRHGLRFEVREPTHLRTGNLAWVRQRPPAPAHNPPLEVGWAWEAPHLALHQIEAANHPDSAA